MIYVIIMSIVLDMKNIIIKDSLVPHTNYYGDNMTILFEVIAIRGVSLIL